jgi:RNA 3'-terminal phosphate cyclase (ATP)
MGEGGGALFRTALALSALTQIPLRIHSIRGAMRRKGMTAEDKALLDALEASTAAEVIGGEIDSQDLTFRPKRTPRAIQLKLDVGSYQEGRVPGGALIIASTLVPILARAGAYSSVTIHGETHANNALSYDAFERITTHAWERAGLCCFPVLTSSGFGFGTRGQVSIDVEPSAIEALEWDIRGGLVRIGAVITVTEMAKEASERAAAMVRTKLGDGRIEPEIDIVEVHGREPGLSVTFWAEFESGLGSGSAVHQRGMNLAAVVERAWDSFEAWFSSKATVDPFCADQILLPAILAEGKSSFTTPCITRRLTTMVWVIKQFMPIRLTVLGREGEPGSVTVDRRN